MTETRTAAPPDKNGAKPGCLRRFLKWMILFCGLGTLGIALLWVRGGGPTTAVSRAFGPPELVTITGYDDHAMEPFLTRDGNWLLFNNSNDPRVNTDLHLARRVTDREFAYAGPLTRANTSFLEGVPTLTADGELFFVSVRDYASTAATIFRARLTGGDVSEVGLASGVGRRQPVWVDFDVEVTPDGNQLFVGGGWFTPIGFPLTADLRFYQRHAGAWEAASDSDRIMAQINSPALEYAAGISSDALELFFTRFGTPPIGRDPAILVATRTSPTSAFGPPVRLAEITGFVEAPTLSPDGQLLYFHRWEGDRFRLFLSRRRSAEGASEAPPATR